MADYAGTDVQGALSIDLDPGLTIGNSNYNVSYWIGVRTPEVAAGMSFDMFATDDLAFEAVSSAGNLDGSAVGSLQGLFMFRYAGLQSGNGARVFHAEIGVFSLLGTLRYDYFITLSTAP